MDAASGSVVWDYKNFEPLPRIELGFADYEKAVLPLNYKGF